MRDLIIAVMAICVAVAGGFVWGCQYKGRSFERARIALEAGVRLRAKREADQLRLDLAEAKRQTEEAERLAETSDRLKTEAVTRLEMTGGCQVTDEELGAINATIREVRR